MAAEFGAIASSCACVSVLDAIYKEIEIKDMIQKEKQSGFVAGTLVHTDKGLVPIDQINVTNGILSTNVYNLEVEENHTYFVGEEGIWVHDASANIS